MFQEIMREDFELIVATSYIIAVVLSVSGCGIKQTELCFSTGVRQARA